MRGGTFGPDGKLRESENTSVAKMTVLPRGLRFEMTNRLLPKPLVPGERSINAWLELVSFRLGFDALPKGRYVLSIDGRPVADADAEGWTKGGQVISGGPEQDQVEALRRAINEKNRLYFYRWRPQNETYLFGFRKHEQGNNAREIPLFDPLIEEQEKEIARLRVPVSHVYELVRESEESK
jgi:hypothetical protein